MKVTKWLLTNCKTIFSLYSQQKMFKKVFSPCCKKDLLFLKVNKSYSSTALYSLKLMDIPKLVKKKPT
ncbi:Uncharacterised protein [Acinetobacter baumannii]|nr:Uncharacterised protein [Acinetobacter baumannii]